MPTFFHFDGEKKEKKNPLKDVTARQGWAEERRRWNSLSTDLTQAQSEYFSRPVAVSGCVQSRSSPLKVPLCFKYKSEERAGTSLLAAVVEASATEA